MRNGLMIFLIGFILGSTLGFGGMWTQVVKPAKAQIEELEREHNVLSQAVDMASQAMRDAVAELRSEAAPEPSDVREATGPADAPRVRFTRTLRLADELENKVETLEQARIRR